MSRFVSCQFEYGMKSMKSYLVAMMNGKPPIWSKWAWEMRTFGWKQLFCGHLPVSNTTPSSGRIMHVSWITHAHLSFPNDYKIPMKKNYCQLYDYWHWSCLSPGLQTTICHYWINRFKEATMLVLLNKVDKPHGILWSSDTAIPWKQYNACDLNLVWELVVWVVKRWLALHTLISEFKSVLSPHLIFLKTVSDQQTMQITKRFAEKLLILWTFAVTDLTSIYRTEHTL